MKTVFYAWQSDLPNNTNRSFLESCLERAIEKANTALTRADRLVLDKDTQGIAGMPVIADVVFEKIASCAVFVPDLSIITPAESKRATPNPNVLVELGYALCAIKDRRIVGLINSAFGASSDLPFDLRNRRFPISYRLAEGGPSEDRKSVREILIAQLVEALSLAASQAPPEVEPVINPLPDHAVAPIEESSFVVNGGGQLAQTRARDNEGRDSEYIFWHHGPSAWLRVVPVCCKSYRRPQLIQMLNNARDPIRPFGESVSVCRATNARGEVLSGFDDDLPDAIATRVTQVFLTGEIWGLNKTLVVPREENSKRMFQVMWPALANAFEATVRNYLQFASEVLNLEPPVIVIAGVAMLWDAVLVRDKAKWYTDPPAHVRFLENTVRGHWEIPGFDVDPAELLTPWYAAIFDACGLDYAAEPARRAGTE